MDLSIHTSPEKEPSTIENLDNGVVNGMDRPVHSGPDGNEESMVDTNA